MWPLASEKQTGFVFFCQFWRNSILMYSGLLVTDLSPTHVSQIQWTLHMSCCHNWASMIAHSVAQVDLHSWVEQQSCELFIALLWGGVSPTADTSIVWASSCCTIPSFKQKRESFIFFIHWTYHLFSLCFLWQAETWAWWQGSGHMMVEQAVLSACAQPHPCVLSPTWGISVHSELIAWSTESFAFLLHACMLQACKFQSRPPVALSLTGIHQVQGLHVLTSSKPHNGISFLVKAMHIMMWISFSCHECSV